MKIFEIVESMNEKKLFGYLEYWDFNPLIIAAGLACIVLTLLGTYYLFKIVAATDEEDEKGKKDIKGKVISVVISVLGVTSAFFIAAALIIT